MWTFTYGSWICMEVGTKHDPTAFDIEIEGIKSAGIAREKAIGSTLLKL